MAAQNDKVEFGTTLSLDEWLAAVGDPSRKLSHLVTYQFPTDDHRAEYLRTISERSDEDVRRLLRCFLIGSGTLGVDYVTVQHLAGRLKTGSPIPTTEFTRRLFAAALTKGRVQPWEA